MSVPSSSAATLRCPYYRGMALLEVLISAVILSVGLTGVARVFVMGMQAHQQANAYRAGAVLLENQLTRLLANRYWDEQDVGAGTYDEPWSDYGWQITSDAVDGSDWLRKIQVAIVWSGRHQTYSVDATIYLFFLRNEKDEQR